MTRLTLDAKLTSVSQEIEEKWYGKSGSISSAVLRFIGLGENGYVTLQRRIDQTAFEVFSSIPNLKIAFDKCYNLKPGIEVKDIHIFANTLKVIEWRRTQRIALCQKIQQYGSFQLTLMQITLTVINFLDSLEEPALVKTREEYLKILKIDDYQKNRASKLALKGLVQTALKQLGEIVLGSNEKSKITLQLDGTQNWDMREYTDQKCTAQIQFTYMPMGKKAYVCILKAFNKKRFTPMFDGIKNKDSHSVPLTKSQKIDAFPVPPVFSPEKNNQLIERYKELENTSYFKDAFGHLIKLEDLKLYTQAILNTSQAGAS